MVATSAVLLLFSRAQASAAEPTPPQNPTERGDAAMNASKWDEAVKAYTEAIEREPQKAGN